jgi:alpha-galactosidase
MLEDETTNAGCASVELNSVDEIAQLQLQITIELTAGGLIRARASVINLVEDPYAVNDCVIAFPVPRLPMKSWTSPDIWGKERVPQRGHLTVGVHLREGRKGRTGPWWRRPRALRCRIGVNRCNGCRHSSRASHPLSR